MLRFKEVKIIFTQGVPLAHYSKDRFKKANFDYQKHMIRAIGYTQCPFNHVITGQTNAYDLNESIKTLG